MLIVSDSSPLISLHNIGSLDILPKLFGAVHIPKAVFSEITAKQVGIAFSTSTWLIVKEVSDHYAIEEIKTQYPTLNIGEIEAMVLAKELGAEYLSMDERLGRKVANEMGLSLIGVLGILLLAKKKGHLPAIKPAIQALIADGFRLSEKHVSSILKQAGEA